MTGNGGDSVRHIHLWKMAVYSLLPIIRPIIPQSVRTRRCPRCGECALPFAPCPEPGRCAGFVVSGAGEGAETLYRWLHGGYMTPNDTQESTKGLVSTTPLTPVNPWCR